VVSILRTANYFAPFFFTGVQSTMASLAAYNVLRILRGAGLGGLPTLDIAERMIEQARYNPPAGSLGREEVRAPGTPFHNRRQVLCYITKLGLDLLRELDSPVRKQDNQALHRLNESEIEN